MNDFLVKFCGSYALVVIERRDLDVRSEIKNKGDFRRISAQPHRRGLLIK
jgi:hypothetical protein